MENPLKIDEKSSKNRSWRRPGVSWGSLGCLTAVLGRSWTVLRASKSVLGASWGRPGGVLERPGGVLVANTAPTWLPKCSQNHKKIEGNVDGNVDTSWDLIFYGFG